MSIWCIIFFSYLFCLWIFKAWPLKDFISFIEKNIPIPKGLVFKGLVTAWEWLPLFQRDAKNPPQGVATSISKGCWEPTPRSNHPYFKGMLRLVSAGPVHATEKKTKNWTGDCSCMLFKQCNQTNLDQLQPVSKVTGCNQLRKSYPLKICTF